MTTAMSKYAASKWLARYAALYFGLVFGLFLAASHDADIFLVLSSLLFFAVGFLARRSSGGSVRMRLWTWLLSAMLLFWGLFNLVAQGSGGPEESCLPTYRQPALWTRMMEIPPDPNCQGGRLDD